MCLYISMKDCSGMPEVLCRSIFFGLLRKRIFTEPAVTGFPFSAAGAFPGFNWRRAGLFSTVWPQGRENWTGSLPHMVFGIVQRLGGSPKESVALHSLHSFSGHPHSRQGQGLESRKRVSTKNEQRFQRFIFFAPLKRICSRSPLC